MPGPIRRCVIAAAERHCVSYQATVEDVLAEIFTALSGESLSQVGSKAYCRTKTRRATSNAEIVDVPGRCNLDEKCCRPG